MDELNTVLAAAGVTIEELAQFSGTDRRTVSLALSGVLDGPGPRMAVLAGARRLAEQRRKLAEAIAEAADAESEGSQ